MMRGGTPAVADAPSQASGVQPAAPQLARVHQHERRRRR
jgi:hypothetical protein